MWACLWMPCKSTRYKNNPTYSWKLGPNKLTFSPVSFRAPHFVSCRVGHGSPDRNRNCSPSCLIRVIPARERFTDHLKLFERNVDSDGLVEGHRQPLGGMHRNLDLTDRDEVQLGLWHEAGEADDGTSTLMSMLWNFSLYEAWQNKLVCLYRVISVKNVCTQGQELTLKWTGN